MGLAASEWGRVRPILWRGMLVMLIMGSALVAFSVGVDVSDRPGVVGADLLTRIYYSSGLFVLGGLDLGVPVGGPIWARYLLWFAYFGGPFITGFAVVEGLFRAVSPDRFRLRRVRNHLIIVGHSGVAELYLSRLREVDPRKTVVLVLGNAAAMPAMPADLRIVVVRGEIRSTDLVQRLRLEYAERVILALEDSFDNLDAAALLLGEEKVRGHDIIVHLNDLSLLRAVSGTRVGRECTIFNAHHIAATHLVRSELLEWFDHTVEDDIVVLGGFGRFGQTVLAELQSHASGRFDTVIIVDPKANELCERFQYTTGFMKAEYDHHLICDDMASHRLWNELETRFELSKHTPAIVLGCGNDGINIRAALHAAEKFPDSRILAGIFDHSAFANDLARDKGIRIISVAQLVRESMPASWFGARQKTLLSLVTPRRS